jgi:hypothetical protein
MQQSRHEDVTSEHVILMFTVLKVIEDKLCLLSLMAVWFLYEPVYHCMTIFLTSIHKLNSVLNSRFSWSVAFLLQGMHNL